MKRPQYSRFAFIVGYIWWKLAVLFEVKSPRFKFFIFEIRYSIANFVRGAWNPHLPKTVWKGSESIIKTSLGNFKVRPGTQDAAIISPGFERQDYNELKNLLTRLVSQGKTVLFLDIGANIGKFTVAALSEVKHPNLSAIAFEPIPENRAVLEENLRLNNIQSRFSIVPKAISNFEGNAKIQIESSAFGNSSLKSSEKVFDSFQEIPVTTLDSLALNSLKKVLVLKIDVEGSEPDVLKGGLKSLKGFERAYLMLEDTLWSRDLEVALENLGARPYLKRTPYNSWWTW